MKREDLEHAIDRAVRDMMDVDPPPGLRERVRARLEVRARPLFGPLRLAGLTACAAALALLVWMFGARPAERVPDATIVQTSPPAATQQATPVPQPVQPAVTRPERAAAPVAAARPDRLVQAASIDISELPEVEPIAIEEIDAIAPLAVAMLQPEPIAATTDIRIAPLQVDDIEIAPLTSPR
jgi:hypothetical protein